jgi:RNA polymerase sigma-70 factor, ECF subfamily
MSPRPPAARPPDGDVDERRLVEEARKDPSRFAGLYERNFDLVYGYVARRLRDRAEIEDLTSEVFRRALAYLPRFEWRGVPFAAWLLRIAANMVSDHVRRSARQRPAAAPDLVEEPDLEEAERRAALFGLVEALPKDQRRVIVLRFAHDKSIREIARALRRSEGAVKQLQFRALRRLRARMGKSHG